MRRIDWLLLALLLKVILKLEMAVPPKGPLDILEVVLFTLLSVYCLWQWAFSKEKKGE